MMIPERQKKQRIPESEVQGRGKEQVDSSKSELKARISGSRKTLGGFKPWRLRRSRPEVFGWARKGI